MLGVLGGCAGGVKPTTASYGEPVTRGQTPELYLWLKKSGDKWVFDDKLDVQPRKPSKEGVAVALSNLDSAGFRKTLVSR